MHVRNMYILGTYSAQFTSNGTFSGVWPSTNDSLSLTASAGEGSETVAADDIPVATEHAHREMQQTHEETKDDVENDEQRGDVNGMDPGGGGNEELNEEEEISPTDSGETEEEGVSSEWTQSGSEVESLGWIRDLHLLPMVTPPPTSPTSTTSTSSSLWDLRRNSSIIADLDHLIADVQVGVARSGWEWLIDDG